MKKEVLMIIFGILILISLISFVSADCISGKTVGKNISQYGITWFFDKEYTCGTFVNGDYWVKTDSRGIVNVTRITPDFDGQHNGWEVNPFHAEQQGFDIRINKFNISFVPNLPYLAFSNQSLVKSISDLVSCSDTDGCLTTAAVLTVLDTAPPDNSFRPGYFGKEKVIYSFDNADLSFLPAYPRTSSIAAVAPSFSSQEVEDSLKRVQLDHTYGYAARRMHPDLNMPDFGSDISVRNADAVLLLSLNYSQFEKKNLSIYLIQAGIDYYSMVLNNIKWQPEGAHGEGRKILLLFAAYALNDAGMNSIVSNTDLKIFGEDVAVEFRQEANNGQGMSLVSQVDCDEEMYWRKLASDSTTTGSRTCRDPYGFIDGGANPGVSYIYCCLSGPWRANALALHLIPEFKLIWNDSYFLDYVDRYVNFGIWTQPDQCAPTNNIWPDPEYGITFGPDPQNPGHCIIDKDNTDGTGRKPLSHGTDGFGIHSELAKIIWETYRNCSNDKMDGTEEGVDCGGICPNECGTPTQCTLTSARWEI